MTFSQKRNDVVITKEHMTNVVAKGKEGTLSESAIRDLIVASICIKYTQSNSVGFSKDGMMVGVGAGQQSRVDCVKLAGRKVTTWYLRQHPKVLALPFKDGVKRQDRVNARVRYIEGDFTAEEKVRWEEQFTTVPEPLTESEKDEFMKQAQGVAISSDAFFPFRDSIDHASKLGVSYVAQPGGSVQDDGYVHLGFLLFCRMSSILYSVVNLFSIPGLTPSSSCMFTSILLTVSRRRVTNTVWPCASLVSVCSTIRSMIRHCMRNCIAVSTLLKRASLIPRQCRIRQRNGDKQRN
jgi:hypothetical protein